MTIVIILVHKVPSFFTNWVVSLTQNNMGKGLLPELNTSSQVMGTNSALLKLKGPFENLASSLSRPDQWLKELATPPCIIWFKIQGVEQKKTDVSMVALITVVVFLCWQRVGKMARSCKWVRMSGDSKQQVAPQTVIAIFTFWPSGCLIIKKSLKDQNGL